VAAQQAAITVLLAIRAFAHYATLVIFFKALVALLVQFVPIPNGRVLHAPQQRMLFATLVQLVSLLNM
jgi:hypothetical protein